MSSELGYLFLGVEFDKFFIDFGHEPFIRYVICKYLLLFCRLPFSFVDCFLHYVEGFYLDDVPIAHFCFRLFSIAYSFLLCQRLVDHTAVSAFLGSLFCSIALCVFVPVSYCLGDYTFVIQLEVQNCDASHFAFIFQHYFGYLGSFLVPYKF